MTTTAEDHAYLTASGVHPSWHDLLAPHVPTLKTLGETLLQMQAAGTQITPPMPQVLRAFSGDRSQVRVIIIGQDPYPTAGHACGLSFSVHRDVTPIPKSLQNIYRELETDLGIAPAPHGDLTSWFDQGVLLLNTSLTTTVSEPAAHRRMGWQAITVPVVTALLAEAAKTSQPLVGILWGRHAQEFTTSFMTAGVPYVSSAHPSPLSARRGFFGSSPFSKTNELLAAQGTGPIDWTVR